MKPIFNRAPLTPNALSPLPLGSVRPEGWLKDQLNTQAGAVKTRLDALWPDSLEPAALCRLEGLVLLAWTVDDADLKAGCTVGIADQLAALQEAAANAK